MANYLLAYDQAEADEVRIGLRELLPVMSPIYVPFLATVIFASVDWTDTWVFLCPGWKRHEDASEILKLIPENRLIDWPYPHMADLRALEAWLADE